MILTDQPPLTGLALASYLLCMSSHRLREQELPDTMSDTLTASVGRCIDDLRVDGDPGVLRFDAELAAIQGVGQ